MNLAEELIDCAVCKCPDCRKKGAWAEAYYRSSVSRAYYGAFWAAREYLVKNGVTIPPNVQVNAFVRDQCLSHHDSNVRTVGSILRSMKRERVKADYKPGAKFDGIIATFQCLQAATVRKLLP